MVIVLPTAAQAQDTSRTDEALFANAEAAFRAGVENKTRFLLARQHFSRAADAYLELHRRGLGSPALYLNLGNAAALADRWPEAIWAYHVGLKLDPNYPGLREHLAFARARVLYPAYGQGRPEPDTWPTWLHRPTICELSCIGGLSYSLAWLLGAAALVVRKPRLYLLTMSMIVIAAMSGVGLWYEIEQARTDRHTPLVVVAANTELQRGNGASYPPHTDVPILPRGLEARVLHQRGGWLQIRLSTGEIGWLPRGRVLVVEP